MDGEPNDLNPFTCPITLEFMIDPVVASDGHTYERYAIQDMLNRNGRNGKSPITREPLAPNLYPNRTLKSLMDMIAKTNQDFRNEYERVRTELPPPPIQNTQNQVASSGRDRLGSPPQAPFGAAGNFEAMGHLQTPPQAPFGAPAT